MPHLLSESRLNRRLHRFTLQEWGAVLTCLSESSSDKTFLIESCPVPVCRLKRAFRGRLSPFEKENPAYLGRCYAKEETYDGLKAHTVTTASGRPVEVLLLCARSHDLTGMKELALSLPKGATLYADKAYNDYEYEAQLAQEKSLTFQPLRKTNSKRPHPQELAQTIAKARKRIETTFSRIQYAFTAQNPCGHPTRL